MAAVRIPLIFDTDLGDDIDDLYALYLALFHPMLDVIAVTTVHGDTQAKARLASKVLRLAGRPDIPVAAGIGMSRNRIKRNQRHPVPEDHATYQIYVSESDPEFGRTYPAAIDLMRSLVKKTRVPLAVIGEGALSNVAELIQLVSSDDKRNLRCISIMGGETERVVSEYNVLCDPEAADIVLNSGIPVFMATLDLTSRLCLTMDEVEKRLEKKNGPFRVLYECTKLWAPHRGSKPGPVLYDLVPVFWLANPSLVETTPATVRVELEGTYTRGQTVRVAGKGPVLQSSALDAQALVQDALGMIGEARAAIRFAPADTSP